MALPSRELKRLMAELQHIRCERGQTLINADGPTRSLYFPDSGVVSVLAVYSDGRIVEMATIGREGVPACRPAFVEWVMENPIAISVLDAGYVRRSEELSRRSKPHPRRADRDGGTFAGFGTVACCS